MSVFPGWERGSNRHETITSQPILPNLPGPTASRHSPHPCSRMSAQQWMGFPFSLPKSCCITAGPCQERPISPLAQAHEDQAQGDTSRDSCLILAKPLQSPTAQTQTRLLQSLIKLKKLWPDPYGNGNMLSLAQSLSSHVGFQVPLSKYGSIRSFQRKGFLNYYNTLKNNVFFPGSHKPLKYLAEFFFLKKNKSQSHDIRTGSCT